MAEDLFENAAADRMRRDAPLARRVAPRTLDEFAGQDHILSHGKILRRSIESDRITSLILYGPPGCGKTALARIIAMRTKARFEPINAVTSGVKELRELIAAAKQRKIHENRKTIVFVDEIHRFNRAQQDALLPDVENGSIVFIGATTENPFFSVVAPLLSRSQIFEFKRHDEENLIRLLRRCLTHPELGFESVKIEVDDEAFTHIARYAEGDVRRAMNALEIGLLTTPVEEGVLHITESVAKECIQKKMLHYDGSGDEHYDAASAMIKSMRGSNPDAAIYWMARMLEAGETPRFVARRICIAASEDVGNADPMALVVANNAMQACEVIGMPEARILLSQAAIYVATAPKSNATYLAIDAALARVREEKTLETPEHLKDAHYKGAKRLGHGIGYEYAHDHEGGYVTQDYGVPRGTFYTPTDRGHEAKVREYLHRLDERDKEIT
ncbi:MAG: replication-associated recombination protein A [Candidatus Hydrogenedentes bacterium]|nr:replication-associated recombination protein A [Candidatus Hydrogenedentota bacterium]